MLPRVLPLVHLDRILTDEQESVFAVLTNLSKHTLHVLQFASALAPNWVSQQRLDIGGVTSIAAGWGTAAGLVQDALTPGQSDVGKRDALRMP